jgi:anti-anti-sigma factor
MSTQRLDTIEGCVLIHPRGEINLENANTFLKWVESVLEGGFNKLLFDCAEVPYMCSTAVGLLPHFLKQARERRGPSPVFPRTFCCPACGRWLKAGKAGRFRCSGCKTILRIDEAGSARPAYDLANNDYELVPERTEKAICLLGELSSMVRRSSFGVAEKAAFKSTLGQIVVNLYQREVKDVWAELEEVRG